MIVSNDVNSYEPMDVDTSSTSTHAMDISYNDIDKTAEVKIKEEPCDNNCEDMENISGGKIQIVTPIPPTGIKRFSINIPTRKEKSYVPSNTMLSVIITILALFSLITYHIVNFECSKELDLGGLRQSLSKNLFGQPQAIEMIMQMLERKSGSKILFLYGGTGVGKTLTISLILENLYNYSNIYHYTMPSFVDTFSTDLMLGLTLCPTSLIIVDDLNRTDMYVKGHVAKIIEKSEHLNNNTTIVLVFNCDTVNDQYIKKCDYSFYTDLKQAFSDINAVKMFIKFNSLTEEHLRKCIEKELGNKNLSEREFKNIVKNFNVTLDGCKGVYTKIKLLNIL